MLSAAMRKLVLKPREERRLRRGHLWVFSNEVGRMPEAQPGELVEVVDHWGRSLGSAAFHPRSLICARLLGGDVRELDSEFFRARIGRAARLREELFPGENCYRLVHGESDLLPGLIVDRYAGRLVVQMLSAAMDRSRDRIVESLVELFQPEAILERNELDLRTHEELPLRKGVLLGAWRGPVRIRESGLSYEVDLLDGQKTGFFLDQKRNRAAAARYCPDREVLDCFSNLGGFALHAARGGASRVVGVDASSSVVAAARRNGELNGTAAIEFVQSDVFHYLQQSLRDRVGFDVVILDPPSFAPRKKDVPKAIRAYRRLNEMALNLLRPEGILVTASCSFHLKEEVFYRAVLEAAVRAGRRMQFLERREQSPDHPVLPGMPETRYLKLGVFRVM
jgi:23S rRNA (cytosine1962-C5)-methyltransferase